MATSEIICPLCECVGSTAFDACGKCKRCNNLISHCDEYYCKDCSIILKLCRLCGEIHDGNYYVEKCHNVIGEKINDLKNKITNQQNEKIIKRLEMLIGAYEMKKTEIYEKYNDKNQDDVINIIFR